MTAAFVVGHDTLYALEGAAGKTYAVTNRVRTRFHPKARIHNTLNCLDFVVIDHGYFLSRADNPNYARRGYNRPADFRVESAEHVP
jgi:hypothetical protein